MSRLETKSGGLCVCAYLGLAGLDFPFFTSLLALTVLSSFPLLSRSTICRKLSLRQYPSRVWAGTGRGRLTLLLVQLDGDILLAVPSRACRRLGLLQGRLCVADMHMIRPI